MRAAGKHTLAISLPGGGKQPVAGLRLWNYQKGEDDAYRGIRRLHVCLDGLPLTPPDGALLRKAPGHDRFDHAQVRTRARTLALTPTLDPNQNLNPHPHPHPNNP